MGLSVFVDYFEREVFDVVLNGLIGPFASNQSFGVKYGVLWVGGELILGCVAYQTLALGGKGHIGRSDTVALIVGNDFHTAILKYANTKKNDNKKISYFYPIKRRFTYIVAYLP